MMKPVIAIVIFLFLSGTSYSQTSLQESEKIATFCKVWGFLKYYHPAVAKGEMDWDKAFATRIESLASLHTKTQISYFYSEWIASLGEVKTCRKCKDTISDNLNLNLDLAWLHDTLMFTNGLMDQLQFIRANRNQGKNHYVQYNESIKNTRYNNENPYKDSVFPSPSLRLLGLARYWNIIHYFFPYKYLIGQDWNTVLTEMVPKFKDAKDTIAYHLAMLELTATINDSHAGFSTSYTNQYFGLMWAPFRFKIVDNKAIVVGFYNDSLCKRNDIQLGDVFLKVDGRTVEDVIKDKSKYIGASNEAAKLYRFFYVLFNGNTDSVRVSFERNGVVVEKTLYRYPLKALNYHWAHQAPADTCTILAGNIGYVNLGLLQPKDTDAYMDRLKHTKAIIFDVRNYPNGTVCMIAKYLTAQHKPFAKFTIPDITYPGVYYFTPPTACDTKSKWLYTGKVILLFNETTQSHAEFTLMGLQTAPHVIGVGSQTAGADGNVSEIIFPGDYKTYMTGIGVYYPDGRETQRIGIVPDVEVKPTIAGLKLGKDEVLEKAIEVINGK